MCKPLSALLAQTSMSSKLVNNSSLSVSQAKTLDSSLASSLSHAHTQSTQALLSKHIRPTDCRPHHHCPDPSQCQTCPQSLLPTLQPEPWKTGMSFLCSKSSNSFSCIQREGQCLQGPLPSAHPHSLLTSSPRHSLFPSTQVSSMSQDYPVAFVLAVPSAWNTILPDPRTAPTLPPSDPH